MTDKREVEQQRKSQQRMSRQKRACPFLVHSPRGNPMIRSRFDSVMRVTPSFRLRGFFRKNIRLHISQNIPEYPRISHITRAYPTRQSVTHRARQAWPHTGTHSLCLTRALQRDAKALALLTRILVQSAAVLVAQPSLWSRPRCGKGERERCLLDCGCCEMTT